MQSLSKSMTGKSSADAIAQSDRVLVVDVLRCFVQHFRGVRKSLLVCDELAAWILSDNGTLDYSPSGVVWSKGAGVIWKQANDTNVTQTIIKNVLTKHTIMQLALNDPKFLPEHRTLLSYKSPRMSDMFFHAVYYQYVKAAQSVTYLILDFLCRRHTTRFQVYHLQTDYV